MYFIFRTILSKVIILLELDCLMFVTCRELIGKSRRTQKLKISTRGIFDCDNSLLTSLDWYLRNYSNSFFCSLFMLVIDRIVLNMKYILDSR